MLIMMTAAGSRPMNSVSSNTSNAHMPRVILRTVAPAKLLACQSDEKRCTLWRASVRIWYMQRMAKVAHSICEPLRRTLCAMLRPVKIAR